MKLNPFRTGHRPTESPSTPAPRQGRLDPPAHGSSATPEHPTGMPAPRHQRAEGSDGERRHRVQIGHDANNSPQARGGARLTRSTALNNVSYDPPPAVANAGTGAVQQARVGPFDIPAHIPYLDREFSNPGHARIFQDRIPADRVTPQRPAAHQPRPNGVGDLGAAENHAQMPSWDVQLQALNMLHGHRPTNVSIDPEYKRQIATHLSNMETGSISQRVREAAQQANNDPEQLLRNLQNVVIRERVFQRRQDEPAAGARPNRPQASDAAAGNRTRMPRQEAHTPRARPRIEPYPAEFMQPTHPDGRIYRPRPTNDEQRARPAPAPQMENSVVFPSSNGNIRPR